jgi:hypothetical protein
MKDSLQFNFVYTRADGNTFKETSFLYVYDNNSKLSFDSAQFDIAEVRRRGVRLSIYAEREGYENNRPAELQVKFLVGSGRLNIKKGVRFGEAIDYSIRNRLTLTKK